MPTAKTPAFVEGDIIEKSDLTALKDSVEEIHKDIDASNVRQEGLDRRVFLPRAHSTNKGAHNNVYSTEAAELERTELWSQPNFPALALKNSQQTSQPVLAIPWDPEVDTDVIIRVSFLIDTRNTVSKPHMFQDNWDFGLRVMAPGESETGVMIFGTEITEMEPYGDQRTVWPYQKVQLNFPFTAGARYGMLSYTQLKDDHRHCQIDSGDEYEFYNWSYSVGQSTGGDDATDYFVMGWGPPYTVYGPFYNYEHSGWSESDTGAFMTVNRNDGSNPGTDCYSYRFIDPDEGYVPTASADYYDNEYPRGDWFQYQYDRASNMNQSVTLICRGTSKDSVLPRESRGGAYRFLKAGTARVGLVYRCNKGEVNAQWRSPDPGAADGYKSEIDGGDFYIAGASANYGMGGVIAEEHLYKKYVGEAGAPKIENLRMSYQIIRR